MFVMMNVLVVFKLYGVDVDYVVVMVIEMILLSLIVILILMVIV